MRLHPKLKEIQETWLPQADIDELQSRIDNGELTSEELVHLYFSRIARYNHSGPKLNAVLEVNPDALQIATALDVERAAKGKRSMLHGIPIMLKDNIDTNDKMHTSAGSLLLKDSYANNDAFLVKKLRAAGAIILGKTNMSEWSFFMAMYGMPNGYSSRGGQVLNPYGPGIHDVGGSSSGSAVAVAMNMATVAVGTETSGSIITPASQNSLVGIKPTIGLIGRTGLIPISHTQDTAGPLARTVKDAVILLTEMIGIDNKDPITRTNPLKKDDLLKATKSTSLHGLRLGVPQEGFLDYFPEEKRNIIVEALEYLKESGAVIIDDVAIPSTKAKWSMNVLIHEFKVNINAYLSKLNPPLTLHNIIKMNEANKERMLRYGQSLLIKAEQTSGTLTEEAYLEALAHDRYYATDQGIDAALQSEELNALVFANASGAPMAARAGYPSITVPAGYTKENEPVGITFTGTKFSEETLIKIATVFERATNIRVHPPFF